MKNNNKKNILQRIGGVISTLLLGDTKIKIGEMGKDIDNIKDDIKEIKPDLKDVRERVAKIESRLSPVTSGASPVSLTDLGKRILEESGIKNFVDERKDDLLTQLKKERTGQLTSAYDIQEWCFKTFDKLSQQPELPKTLKEYAFQKGVSLSDIFRVGAIYFRDIAIKEFGLKIEDLNSR